jgi:group II intron reverse transcriptase/maturase
VYRPDILREAWRRVKAKKGAGGIDRMTLEDVLIIGEEKFLEEIAGSLKEGSYKALPVKRALIPKSDGSKRPLGLPTIKDKVVQMATKLVMEPIFEADFKDCSYGFRPKRSQHMALEATRKAMRNKGYWVVDADIKSYFDHINHDKLMTLVGKRINDRRVLKLVKNWLKAGVMYEEELLVTETGSPQGGVISPLLSNIYLNYLDSIWEKHGLKHGKLIRFADDCVIICKNKKDAERAVKLLEYVMDKLELTLNYQKTRLVNTWGGQDGFDFLSIHHRRVKTISRKGNVYYKSIQFLSRKAMKRIKTMVKMVTGPRSHFSLDLKVIVEHLNPKIMGWRNYYGIGESKEWLKKIDWYILSSITRWNNKKRQRERYMSGVKEMRIRLKKLGLLKLAQA